ncbi:hypothetical protein RUM43_000231 [Polyplax serrata]|uniref:Uncharacterized protein n=1 Tax=Polyplax serrata TaxID=468196 RepID=A0AAN8SFL6_POLSC
MALCPSHCSFVLFKKMEPKIIKEEVPDLKDGNDMTPPPSSDSVPTTRRPKGKLVLKITKVTSIDLRYM